jgi:polygalacturonase
LTQNYHTPIVTGENNSPTTINTRLSTLDTGLTSLLSTLHAVDDRLDDLIVDSGTSDAETIAARSAINYLTGSPPATLGDALAYAAGNVYNVLAYGAVANGSTDNAAAFQAAIDAAAAGGGGTVWVPRAATKYKLTGEIELDSNVWLMSDGATLDMDGSTVSVSIYAVGQTNVRISGFRMEAQNSDGSGNSRVPVSFDGCSVVWFDHNEIDITPVEGDVNTAALRVSDDPANTDNATNDYHDIWITNNVIRPASLGILAQSRLSQDCEMRRLYILGNTIDYANIDASTMVTDVPAGIKIDLNVRDCVIADNILYGRDLATHGINVQEDLHNCVITGNVVKEFDTAGIIVEAGQTVAEVQNVTISHNTISDMIGSMSRGIYVACSTATTWKNISIIGNIVSDCAGYGIYEDGAGNRIANYVVEGNTISECQNIGIYVRSHRALISGNVVTTTASVACVSIVGSALNCAVVGNRLDSAAGGLADTGSGTIFRNNVIDDVWTPGTESTSIMRRWRSGDYWMVEGIVTALSLPVTVQTSLTLAAIAEVGGPARGAYYCKGEIISGSSASGSTRATFAASFRMTDASTVSSQEGEFISENNSSVFSAVDLHTDLTNVILRVTNGSGSVSLDNLMIHFTLYKTDDL